MSKDRDGFSHHVIHKTVVTRRLVINGKEIALNPDGSVPEQVLADLAAELNMTAPALQEWLKNAQSPRPLDANASASSASTEVSADPDEPTVDCPRCQHKVLKRHGWCMHCGHKMHD